jgi:hypothetical protein
MPLYCWCRLYCCCLPQQYWSWQYLRQYLPAPPLADLLLMLLLQVAAQLAE